MILDPNSRHSTHSFTLSFLLRSSSRITTFTLADLGGVMGMQPSYQISKIKEIKKTKQKIEENLRSHYVDTSIKVAFRPPIVSTFRSTTLFNQDTTPAVLLPHSDTFRLRHPHVHTTSTPRYYKSVKATHPSPFLYDNPLCFIYKRNTIELLLR